MKLFFRCTSAFFSAVFLLLFVSCDKDGGFTSINVNRVAEAITEAVPLKEGYYPVSDSYFKYYFKDNEGNAILENMIETENFTVRRSKSQSSENEFGVFSVDIKYVKEVKASCEKYIETKTKAYLESKASYSPEEYEKFRDAKVLTYENLVVYFIMTRADIDVATRAIDTLYKN